MGGSWKGEGRSGTCSPADFQGLFMMPSYRQFQVRNSNFRKAVSLLGINLDMINDLVRYQGHIQADLELPTCLSLSTDETEFGRTEVKIGYLSKQHKIDGCENYGGLEVILNKPLLPPFFTTVKEVWIERNLGEYIPDSESLFVLFV
jgi:hypothetical protein